MFTRFLHGDALDQSSDYLAGAQGYRVMAVVGAAFAVDAVRLEPLVAQADEALRPIVPPTPDLCKPDSPTDVP